MQYEVSESSSIVSKEPSLERSGPRTTARLSTAWAKVRVGEKVRVWALQLYSLLQSNCLDSTNRRRDKTSSETREKQPCQLGRHRGSFACMKYSQITQDTYKANKRPLDRRDYHIVVLGAGMWLFHAIPTLTHLRCCWRWDEIFWLTSLAIFPGGVGKSCLTGKAAFCLWRIVTDITITAQFVQNVWIESYDPTIEDSYRKQIEVDVSFGSRCQARSCSSMLILEQGRQCMLEMWDLDGIIWDDSNLSDFRLDTAGTEQFSKSHHSRHHHVSILTFSSCDEVC